jgi:hypothetical protein
VHAPPDNGEFGGGSGKLTVRAVPAVVSAMAGSTEGELRQSKPQARARSTWAEIIPCLLFDG